MIDNISCVIIVSNAKETINKCLNSLTKFSEIIVFINNSTDQTKEKAQKYSNVVIHEGEFKSFSNARNIATSFARNDWVFHIDADEWIDENLIEVFQRIDLTDNSTLFFFKLYNYYMGRIMKGGILRPRWKNRMYNRTQTKFLGDVHEYLDASNMRKIKTDGHFYHSDPIPISNRKKYQNLVKEAATKNIRYLKLQSQAKKHNTSIIYNLIEFLFRFINLYIIKLGFIDGWAGVLCNYRICKYKYDVNTTENK